MKVLLLNGSPKPNGNTNKALEEVAKTLQAEGIDTEILHVAGKVTRGCIGCGGCKGTGRCVFGDDDMVNEALAKMEGADGLIVGSPVYFASPNGSLISFLDRFFYAGKSFTHKPAAAISVARRAGTVASFDVMNKYFTIRQMPVVSSRYWNDAFGAAPGQVEQDAEGMQIMRILGKNMAWMLKVIDCGKQNGIMPPASEEVTQTNYIR